MAPEVMDKDAAALQHQAVAAVAADLLPAAAAAAVLPVQPDVPVMIKAAAVAVPEEVIS